MIRFLPGHPDPGDRVALVLSLLLSFIGLVILVLVEAEASPSFQLLGPLVILIGLAVATVLMLPRTLRVNPQGIVHGGALIPWTAGHWLLLDHNCVSSRSNTGSLNFQLYCLGGSTARKIHLLIEQARPQGART